MPSEVQITNHDDEWVCRIRPQWDRLTVWLLLREVFVLSLLGLLITVIVGGGNMRIMPLPRMTGPTSPYAYLGLLVVAVLEVSRAYRFVRWMRQGERVTLTRTRMRVLQPSVFKRELAIPIADIGSLSLEEHHRGTSILRPEQVLSGGRIQVWAESGWHSFGRGLSQTDAQNLLETVRSEMRRRGWRAPEEDQEELGRPKG